ncbi:MAG: hypothetical protein ACTSO7_04390 [Candidatus Heimdallarchaeota archaeon]
MLFHDPYTPYIRNDNDAKGIFLGSNSTIDCYTDFDDFNAYFDSNRGGDNNCVAKCHVDLGEKVTVEYDILFQTADIPEAYDFDIDVGDTIEVIFWYLDNTGYYSGYLYNSTEFEYGIVDVGGLPPVTTPSIGLSTTAMILSVFSVNLFVLLIAKKKKK